MSVTVTCIAGHTYHRSELTVDLPCELCAKDAEIAALRAANERLVEALTQLRAAMIEEHGCYPTDRNTRVGHIICDAMEAADAALAPPRP